MRRVVIATVAVFASLGVATASLAAAGSVEIRDVAAEKAPDVHVVVRVLNPDGEPLAGLTVGSFSVFEDDRAVTGLAARQSHPEGEPLAIAALIDISGSMDDASLAAAKDGTKSLLGVLTPEDKREVLAFESSVHSVLGFTDPPDLSPIDRLDQQGNTVLYDVIGRAIDDLSGQAASNRAVVLLTDGKDDGSTLTREQVLAKVQAAKIPIFAIALKVKDRVALDQIAAASGGTVLTASGPDDLANLYGRIAAGLLTEYRLSYKSAAKPGTHKVTVVAKKDAIDAVADRAFVIADPLGAAPPPAPKETSPILIIVLVLGALIAIAAVTLVLRRPPKTPGVVVVAGVAPGGFAPPQVRSTAGARVMLVSATASFPLVGSGLVVGRDPRAHIVIDDPSVSRTHARLDVDGDGVWVEDLGSVNGTVVNGQRVTRCHLGPGDVLELGDQRLVLHGVGV